MRHFARFIAKAIAFLSPVLKQGGGTSAPGLALLKLDPKAITRMANGLSDGRIVVSATNGKTTTTRILSKIIDKANIPSVSNAAGANLKSGIATTLLRRSPNHKLGVFEVDEGVLPEIVAEINANTIVLMNLFRDQLDRYGELEKIRENWKLMIDALPASTKLLVNADDPSLVFVSLDHPNLVFFGLGDTRYALESIPHAADSSQCPRCNNQLQYSQVTISHMGDWSCTQCGLSRPNLDFEATEIELQGVESIKFKILSRTGEEVIEAKLPGLHNVYNALAAFTAAKQLDIETAVARTAIASVNAAFGRTESIQLGDKKLTLLLAKNPAGANSNLDTLLLHPDRFHLAVLLNDRIADGKDVSWIWDVDYEKIFHKIESMHVGGERAYDLALRFMYGGYSPERVIVNDEIDHMIDCLITKTPSNETIFVLPSYTAMLDLRAELVNRGLTHDFWEEGL